MSHSDLIMCACRQPRNPTYLRDIHYPAKWQWPGSSPLLTRSLGAIATSKILATPLSITSIDYTCPNNINSVYNQPVSQFSEPCAMILPSHRISSSMLINELTVIPIHAKRYSIYARLRHIGTGRTFGRAIVLHDRSHSLHGLAPAYPITQQLRQVPSNDFISA